MHTAAIVAAAIVALAGAVVALVWLPARAARGRAERETPCERELVAA